MPPLVMQWLFGQARPRVACSVGTERAICIWGLWGEMLTEAAPGPSVLSDCVSSDSVRRAGLEVVEKLLTSSIYAANKTGLGAVKHAGIVAL